jgi:hypothetical protein
MNKYHIKDFNNENAFISVVAILLYLACFIIPTYYFGLKGFVLALVAMYFTEIIKLLK